MACVGTAVGKNKNCPLFGSRSNWNGTGGGNTDSIGIGAEISTNNELIEIKILQQQQNYNKICSDVDLNQLHPLSGHKIKRLYARLITQIANGDGILMRLFTKIISAVCKLRKMQWLQLI